MIDNTIDYYKEATKLIDAFLKSNGSLYESYHRVERELKLLIETLDCPECAKECCNKN